MLYEVITVLQKAPGDLGLQVGKYRAHVGLGVPEEMPLIALGGQALGGDAGSTVPAGGLQEMKKVEMDRPLALRITSYNVCYTKLLRLEDRLQRLRGADREPLSLIEA